MKTMRFLVNITYPNGRSHILVTPANSILLGYGRDGRPFGMQSADIPNAARLMEAVLIFANVCTDLVVPYNDEKYLKSIGVSYEDLAKPTVLVDFNYRGIDTKIVQYKDGAVEVQESDDNGAYGATEDFDLVLSAIEDAKEGFEELIRDLSTVRQRVTQLKEESEIPF